MDAGDAGEVVEGEDGHGEDFDVVDGGLGLREAHGVRAGRVGPGDADGGGAVVGNVPLKSGGID